MTEQTVYVVDDDQGVRTGLGRSFRGLGYSVQTFPSAERFFEQRTPNGPSCLVLDLVMPGMPGLEALRRIPGDDSLRTVVLTGYGDVPSAVRAMKSGVVEFLEKPVKHETLVSAVEEALRQSEAAVTRARAVMDVRASLARLTPTEHVVLEHICAGRATAEIAKLLHRSARTIEKHRQSVLTKMDAKNAADLARMVAFLSRQDRPPFDRERGVDPK
ncbi:MAG: response regulator [Planctomycetota bacterium]|nr:response regulator [Planctomycetota bacterium]